MKRLSALAAAFAGLCIVPLGAQDPEPTRTPSPAALRGATGNAPKSSGGSLADAVKRSKQRTQSDKKKPSLGVITNDELQKSQAGGSGKPKKTGTLTVVPSKGSNHSTPDVSAGTVGNGVDNNGGTEAEWRARSTALKLAVKSAEEQVKRLTLESKRLENDYYAWSDGNHREGVIRPAWDSSVRELKKAQADLEQAQAALGNLGEEARKAGALPGWIR